MNFKHLLVSALMLSSASIYADTIGWGNDPQNPGGAPGRPNQPSRPSQPSQPSYPSQPSRPSQPSYPSQPSRPGHPRPSEPSYPSPSYPSPSYPSPSYPSPSYPSPSYPSPSYPSPSYPSPSYPSPSYPSAAVEENIQQYFNGWSTFDLLEDYYTQSQLQGLRIRDITIIASSDQGNGQISLALNGQSIESSKMVFRQMSSFNFIVDQSANSVGQSLRAIGLSMQGRIYVEKVIFNISGNSGPSYPGPTFPPQGQSTEVIRQSVGSSIVQEGGIELSRIFNLGSERQGQVIRRVNVFARSSRGQGYASLLLNGQQISSSQTVGYSSTRLSFDVSPGMRIGYDLQSLKLYFRGDMVIDEIQLEVERRSRY